MQDRLVQNVPAPNACAGVPALIIPAEAAKMLRISKGYLAKLRMDGNGPEFVKIGWRVYYTVDAIAAYVAANTRRSTLDQH